MSKVDAGLNARQCKEERRLSVGACSSVLHGNPTPQCCYRIRVAHVECVCPVITPQLVAFIDVPRLIRIVQGCGRRVPRHFKCGSITTP
ncbi:hypothetical protein FRX31_035312 [Thalictrum thalictroides]|uniref:Bifunctional inhibitor/plant lipid transfer protein/seed storage helical domain-containing protein n=1 Tax=Thalictrum thalictroides TaxID=46969 RepID=A0A7J6URA3_THATH|nr:hypothetical protein FRX31_035312 [Thalictrum thalictroides]